MSQVTTLLMPKHEGLALHIHKQTRSKELIRMMSKFGYSISYDDTQRCIDTFSHQGNQQTLQNGIFVPPNLVQGKFLHCILDKLDFQKTLKVVQPCMLQHKMSVNIKERIKKIQ